MRIKDPKPEIQRLEELIYSIRMGEIRLPMFQRPFVWKKHDVIKLFDSIYKGYPIGSILLWNTNEKLISSREIAGFKLAQNDTDTYPTNYLLDGQQRLTSLVATLYWDKNDKNSIWNIHFDLDEECFVHPKDDSKINLFPLNKLMSTSEFIKQCMKFEHTNKSTEYIAKSERLLKAFKDYKIAVVKIGDVTLDEVAPIFERINSTGRKLTIVDLMRAATWKGGFDLADAMKQVNQTLGEFGDIPDSTVLRLMAGALGFGINKADMDKLRTFNRDELSESVKSINKAFSTVRSFYEETIGIRHMSFVPYNLQTVLLCEFFRNCNAPTKNQICELEKWFWKTSVSRYFSGASTGQISKDLSAIRSFAKSESSTISFNALPIDLESLYSEEFNLRNASSKTIALLLIRRFNCQFTEKKHESIGRIELDRSLFGDIKNEKGEEYNINISQIIFPMKVYSAKNEEVLTKISEYNFIQDPLYDLVKQRNYGKFFELRKSNLTDEILKLTGLTERDIQVTQVVEYVA